MSANKILSGEYNKWSNPKYANELPEDISVGLKEGNLFEWNVVMLGPEDSLYEGGTFQLSISFPTNFPFAAPKFKFITRIFHPNVDENGLVCERALWGEQWAATTKIADVLRTIQGLLRAPDFDNAINGAVAKLDKTAFEKSAREWTTKYAG